MSTCRVLAGLAGGAVVGGVVCGAFAAGTGAASGAIGAAVLDRCYGGYDVLQATQMVAAGSATLLGATGAIVGGIVGAVSAGVPNVKVEANSKSSGLGLLGFVAETTLGGLVGYGLFLSTATSSLALNVGQVAASAATGSAIFGGALTVGLLACVCCCVGAAALDDNQKEAELEEGRGVSMKPAM